MSTYRLPPISSLPSLPPSDLHELLSHLFEPSPALHTLITTTNPPTSSPASYPDFINSIHQTLLALYEQSKTSQQASNQLLTILSSHPRLGAKKVDSTHSQAEQKSLAGEGEELQSLNEEYERTFPGLRYVVFVNGRSRAVVMEDMRRRIARGDADAERIEGIQAMCDIAKDRAAKLT